MTTTFEPTPTDSPEILVSIETSRASKAPVKTLTLHLKVKPNADAWLDQASREVNAVWNWGNETSRKSVQRFVGPAQRLSAYDLDKLAAGAGACFDRTGSDVIQRVNAELVTRRRQFKKPVLRFRASGSRRRALGWVPFKAANLRVKGKALTFMGKSGCFRWSGSSSIARWKGLNWVPAAH